jgi:hypothetical protein
MSPSLIRQDARWIGLQGGGELDYLSRKHCGFDQFADRMGGHNVNLLDQWGRG